VWFRPIKTGTHSELGTRGKDGTRAKGGLSGGGIALGCYDLSPPGPTTRPTRGESGEEGKGKKEGGGSHKKRPRQNHGQLPCGTLNATKGGLQYPLGKEKRNQKKNRERTFKGFDAATRGTSALKSPHPGAIGKLARSKKTEGKVAGKKTVISQPS